MEEHGIEVESPIKTLADFERYTPPDLHEPWRFTAIEETVQKYKGNKAVIVHLNDVFSLPRYLMGMRDLLMAIVAQPDKEMFTQLLNEGNVLFLKCPLQLTRSSIEP
jgi:hypothetical protein